MKLLVSAGPTREPIDEIRFISNRSSGRMGFAVAEEGARRGHEVSLVTGPVALAVPEGVERAEICGAREMAEEMLARAERADAVVMAAAVADYCPEKPLPGKLKKSQAPLVLTLVRTMDILLELGRRKRPGQLLVGFSLEPDASARGEAERKFREKNLDLVVLNTPRSFGSEEIDARVFDGSRWAEMGSVSKEELAGFILDWLESHRPSCR